MQGNFPIRVLHITEVLSQAGIETFIMNVYRRIDRSKVQFDFLVLRNEKEFYDEEVTVLGGMKYWVHSEKSNTLIRIIEESKQIYHFLKEKPYDFVHVHYTTPLRAPYLYAALKSGTPYRIYHAHSAYVSGKNKFKLMTYSIMRRNIERWGTHYFACSHAASAWMYSANILKKKLDVVIPPGLDVKKFSFSLEQRNTIRKELGLENSFILIHTGRFTEQKNQAFIVRILEYIKKREPTSKLLLSGVGPLQENIRNLAGSMGLEDDVIFLDIKPEIAPYLSAADVFVMPSLYEGLPLAAVEAQCIGLPCVMSDLITSEVAITDKVTFLSLDDPIEKWCEEIIRLKGLHREDQSNSIRKHGYDINDIADRMQSFYLTGEWK